ncbi:HTH domain-containing protein [Halorubellus sp. JP-L1]|uniref:HTH domain-containing protein n=1 Tax=Halorubellus sp. JP-L1 TaxID=2715753 RepID=UPI00140C0878|nr:HTH domain-containing protein [Halorubellus sp. JP-L1]NHN41842.1 HTH domain-containing protein [Halorubellus sp. JP-L1]
MSLTESQEGIEMGIRTLCAGEPHFCTVEDIATQLDISKQTVRNNIDDVEEARDDIGVRQVGQADVYYIRTDRMEDVWTEETKSVVRLSRDSKADYAELRRTADDSQFDYEIHWYDYKTNELESYSPSPEDVGKATEMWWSEPVAIKITDPP